MAHVAHEKWKRTLLDCTLVAENQVSTYCAK